MMHPLSPLLFTILAALVLVRSLVSTPKKMRLLLA